jgi:hypothetical protein
VGKRAGYAPYRNTELRGQLLDGGKRRIGRPRCGGGELAQLGFAGEVAAVGFAGLRARGGGFIGRMRGLGMRAQGATRAEAVPRPDSGASPSLARA